MTVLLWKLASESTIPYSRVEEVTRWVKKIGQMVYCTACYFTVFLSEADILHLHYWYLELKS